MVEPAHCWSARASAGNRTRGWPTFQILRSWMATANFTTKPPMLDEITHPTGYKKCKWQERTVESESESTITDAIDQGVEQAPS